MRRPTGVLYWVCTGLCLALLAGAALALALGWQALPAQLPMHTDAMGRTDRWGSKNEVLILLAAAGGMFVFMTAIEHFPRFWNSSVTITEENRERIYAVLLGLLCTTKLLTCGMFVGQTLDTAFGGGTGLWLALGGSALVLGNIGYWLFRLWKAR